MRPLYAFALFLLALTSSCTSYPPLPTVQSVDLDRFLGDWYVIGHIPASSEASAYNAVESYRRGEDGEILTTYTFRDGGFDGPIESMHPTGYVTDQATHATWGMRFAWWWPFKLEYLITYLDDDYRTTIIGRTARDYAWIMSRDPRVSEREFAMLVEELRRQGYETAKVRRVPHRWPDPELDAARSKSE
ncbi:MAG: lipocalin family protein [Planctomycetes bacterium]|nr:lipocalin family protein [Planctomycetota bacterium]